MSKLERNWWFIAPVLAITIATTTKLFIEAGIQFDNLNLYRWSIYFICLIGMEYIVSNVLKLVLLFINPTLSKLNK